MISRNPFLLLCSLMLLLPACNNDDDDGPGTPCGLNINDDTVFYEFQHDSSGDTFLAWTDDPGVIAEVEAQLDLPEDQRTQHINGLIERMPQGCTLNSPWSWYFPADGWSMAEVSIEVCDGDPNYVEANLDEFVDNVGRYCPWSAYVLREVPAPF